jgi:hypothetical protein
MNVPAQPTDSDMTIQKALTEFENLLDTVIELRKAQRELSIAHLQAVGENGHKEVVEPIQQRVYALESRLDVIIELDAPDL